LQISELDKEIIRSQIGREPQGIVKVAVRAKNGVPLVLQMRSMVNGKPFPTLYWLCSKDLLKAIGTLETRGLVKDIEQRLQEDDELRASFFANQQQYVAKRNQQMILEDKQQIEARGFEEMFQKYGIGGISQWDKVRCLHMQYAHHLVDTNVVGEILDLEYDMHLLREKDDIK
jgi:hypothetical protein